MQTSTLNPHISVDCVIFGFDSDKLKVLLIDRGTSSGEEHRYTLPGDLIYDNECLDTAARRVLWELTGLSDIYLEQFAAFGDPQRISKQEDQQWLEKVRSHPEARVVTIGYYSLVKMEDYQPVSGSFARSASWIHAEEVTDLPFDHDDIFKGALKTLRERISSRPVGFELLPEKFTLGQLQMLYELVLGRELDKRNFRRKILNLGILEQLDERQTKVAHKPAFFYRFNEKRYRELVETGFDNFRF